MNPQLEKHIADQGALDELRTEAATQEDHMVLDGMQTELSSEREQALSTRLGQFTIQDGVVVAKEDVAAMRAKGEDVQSTTYNGNQR